MIPSAKYLTVATVIAVAGCTYNNGTSNPPAAAAVGGTIGSNIAYQERELNQQLAGSGAVITNTGTQLRVILPEDVTFATGSATVATSFLPALREVARSLNAHPESTVRVVGHTDNVGSAAYNDQLSTERAFAVAKTLVRFGVTYSRITYSGHGSREPITSNASALARAQNRRVEIVITPAN